MSVSTREMEESRRRETHLCLQVESLHTNHSCKTARCAAILELCVETDQLLSGNLLSSVHKPD